MKTKTNKLLSLNSRGIAHFVAPLLIVLLVGVVGTYMLVASKAATPSGSRPAKGYVYVYMEGKKFNSIKVSLTGVDGEYAAKRKCIAQFSDSKRSHIKKLSKSPTKLTCSAIDGDAAYVIEWGNNKKFGSDIGAAAFTRTIDVDAGICTVVHPPTSSEVGIRKVEAPGGKCDVSDSDIPTKHNAEIRLLTDLSTNKKYITGFVEVSVPAPTEENPNKKFDLNKKVCADEVELSYQSKGKITGQQEVINVTRPLKYSENKNGEGYCVAKLSKVKLKPGTYTLSAELGGDTDKPTSLYFNPVQAEREVTIP